MNIIPRKIYINTRKETKIQWYSMNRFSMKSAGILLDSGPKERGEWRLRLLPADTFDVAATAAFASSFMILAHRTFNPLINFLFLLGGGPL